MYQFSISQQTSTYSIEEHVNYINNFIANLEDEKRHIALIEYTILLATINVQQNNGGPFGALAFDPKTQTVLAIGTNHVVPENDPTAHAEVTAARNVLKLGRINLAGLELYTSCECCPMCLSFLIGLGVEKIYYSATRHDAADIGFSDEKQYEMLKAGYDSCCEKSDSPIPNEILIGTKICKYTSSAVDGMKQCCNDLDTFHLPEETTVHMSHKPHPYTLVALDWARIGRVRDENNPDDPECDSDKKDASKILYYSDEIEDIGLDNTDQIFDVVKNGSDNVQQVPRESSLLPFKTWSDFINNAQTSNAKKY